MYEFVQSHFSTNDDVLRHIIPQLHIEKVASTENVFHDLVSCVIEQQIHYRSTKGTFQRLLEQANLDQLLPSNFHIFEDKALPNIKLNQSKYESLSAVVNFFKHTNYDWKSMHELEVREHLSSLKGIGKWTIDMVLIYTLNKPNVFPADDYHLKKIMIQLYGLEEGPRLKKEMQQIAEGWSPYQSLAVRYFFDWKKMQKNLLIS